MTVRRRNAVMFSLSPLGIGGAERNILQLLDRLGRGYNFHVAGPLNAPFVRSVRALDRPVSLLDVSRPSKLNFPVVPRLARMFKQLNADLVHTHNPRGRLLGHPAARLVGAKTVHTFHMSPLFFDRPPVTAWLYRRFESLYNRYVSQALIFVSSNVRDMYQRLNLLPSSGVNTIPNGIDRSRFSPDRRTRNDRSTVRSKLGLSENALLACTVGRLSHQKGIDYLIEAASRLSYTGKLSELYFLIVGDGPLRTELETSVRSKGLHERFVFTGFKSQEEVYHLLAASDLFVLPSRFECFPYTLLEAMAAGRPCIVSDVGGNSELVGDGQNGLVVTRGAVQELAQALRRLSTDEALRLRFGEQSRLKVKSFSAKRMAAKTRAVYDTLLDHKKSKAVVP